jgi:hypothetical protein
LYDLRVAFSRGPVEGCPVIVVHDSIHSWAGFTDDGGNGVCVAVLGSFEDRFVGRREHFLEAASFGFGIGDGRDWLCRVDWVFIGGKRH